MKKDASLDEANEILARAFEGGFFEQWAGRIWERAGRDALRAAAHEMLGAAGEGLKVRIEVKARDVYKELAELPRGDWEKAKDAKLSRVYAVRP
jgi:hypothetical protein